MRVFLEVVIFLFKLYGFEMFYTFDCNNLFFLSKERWFKTNKYNYFNIFFNFVIFFVIYIRFIIFLKTKNWPFIEFGLDYQLQYSCITFFNILVFIFELCHWIKMLWRKNNQYACTMKTRINCCIYLFTSWCFQMSLFMCVIFFKNIINLVVTKYNIVL